MHTIALLPLVPLSFIAIAFMEHCKQALGTKHALLQCTSDTESAEKAKNKNKKTSKKQQYTTNPKNGRHLTTTINPSKQEVVGSNPTDTRKAPSIQCYTHVSVRAKLNQFVYHPTQEFHQPMNIAEPAAI